MQTFFKNIFQHMKSSPTYSPAWTNVDASRILQPPRLSTCSNDEANTSCSHRCTHWQTVAHACHLGLTSEQQCVEE